MKIFLQVMALLLSGIGILLCSQKKRSFWLFSMASGVFWFAIYLTTGLYIALISQTVYMVLSAYGWVAWGKNGRKK